MGSQEDGEGGVPNEQDELYPEEPGLTFIDFVMLNVKSYGCFSVS